MKLKYILFVLYESYRAADFYEKKKVFSLRDFATNL